MTLENPPSAWKPLLWILPAVLTIGLVSMPREEYIADPMAVRCETVSLINTGSLAVPARLNDDYGGQRGQYFYENPITHKWYSKWGVLNTLINVPPLLVQKWWEGSLSYNSDSRVIYLNVYNLLLAAASAVYLTLLAGRYTRSPLVISLFVFTAFYCTYWWNYLRAQNSEIYQTLFMLAWFYHLVSSRPRGAEQAGPAPGRENRHLLFAGIILGGLILVKTVYVILVPVTAAWFFLLETGRWREEGESMANALRRVLLGPALWLFVPVALSLITLLAVNDDKFGSPFEMGFDEWGEQRQPLFSGNIFNGMGRMLFTAQGSMFVCFPILFFALFGYPRFLRNRPADGLLVFSTALPLFLINAKLLNPLGLWAYGPRYMIPLLPLLSLPFIETLEFLFRRLRDGWRIAALGVIALVLGWSFRQQLNVNALPFFIFFRLQAIFAPSQNPEMRAYFTHNTLGTINGDILASLKDKPFRPLQLAALEVTPESRVSLKKFVLECVHSNYYWWPDLPNAAVQWKK